MEFLLLAGIILILEILKNIEPVRDAISTLNALKIPIGFVVLLRGISFLFYSKLLFQGIMGIIAGAILTIEVFILFIKDIEVRNRVRDSMLGLSIPVGFITLIAGFIGLFLR
uniref:DUF350 domain-containing protein n=1 Tax=candidate division WOR-3 bacterium TaxID=2052148 RepID=A0A7C4U935_UNCW3